MNGRERIEAALRGEQPDQTPVMLHNFLLAITESGITHEQYRESPRLMADCHIRALEKYGHDGILLDIDTSVIAGAVGVPVDLPQNQPGRCHQPLLHELEDVGLLQQVTVTDYKYVQNWLEAIRILVNEVGNDIYIRGHCDQAPFSLASMIRRPQEFLMDLMDEEMQDEVHALLRYCTDACKQFVDAMAETGARMISHGDSPAGPDMISPEMYRTYALPYEQEIIQRTHQHGLDYLLHICGKTDIILTDMVASGADCLELDYKTDVQKIRQAISDRSALCGTIDPSGVLCFGSEADVIEETELLLQQMAGNSRFILNAGCAIPAETPSTNLHAMMHCVQ